MSDIRSNEDLGEVSFESPLFPGMSSIEQTVLLSLLAGSSCTSLPLSAE